MKNKYTKKGEIAKIMSDQLPNVDEVEDAQLNGFPTIIIVSNGKRNKTFTNNFVSSAYLRIFREGGIRYDHLYAHLPRPDSSVPEPASFQRLLCGFVFPDGHPALVVLVVISRNVLIEYVTQEELAQVSKSYYMDDITL